MKRAFQPCANVPNHLLSFHVDQPCSEVYCVSQSQVPPPPTTDAVLRFCRQTSINLAVTHQQLQQAARVRVFTLALLSHALREGEPPLSAIFGPPSPSARVVIAIPMALVFHAALFCPKRHSSLCSNALDDWPTVFSAVYNQVHRQTAINMHRQYPAGGPQYHQAKSAEVVIQLPSNCHPKRAKANKHARWTGYRLI